MGPNPYASPGGKVISGQVVNYSSLQDNSISLSQAAAIFENKTTSIITDGPVRTVEIMKLNPESIAHPYYIKSVDVRSTRFVKGLSTGYVYGQIPLAAPVPGAMQLLVKEAGDPSYSTNFGTAATPLKAGSYTFELLGAGIVYYGVVETGGTKNVLGLTNGEVTHQQNNINASLGLIGITPAISLGNTETVTTTSPAPYFTQDLKENITPTTCGFDVVSGISMSAGGGTITVGGGVMTMTANAYLVGVDGTADETTAFSVQMFIAPNVVNVASSGDLAALGPLNTNSCSNKCDTHPMSTMDNTPSNQPTLDAYLAGARTGDLQTFDINDTSTAQLQSQGFKGRMCDSWQKYSQYIYTMTGKDQPAAESDPNWAQIHEDALHLKEFVAYAEPYCERKTVGYRSADVCGCFDSQTQIQMANGTLKAISDIRADDVVWNPKTQTAHRVTEVIAGPEAPDMFEIQSGSRTVLVTQFHPFLTDRGLIIATELRQGDILIDGQSTSRVVSIVTKEADKNNLPVVWNLVLEGESNDDHYVNANGIMTGDLYLQRLIAPTKK
ncbi:MAG: hypothetical protein H7249_06095 [Chitinophagaceae bacterium]|nr:hypothetical protein [Oligoflexus sp.]